VEFQVKVLHQHGTAWPGRQGLLVNGNRTTVLSGQSIFLGYKPPFACFLSMQFSVHDSGYWRTMRGNLRKLDQVVKYDHLYVTLRARTDANGWNRFMPIKSIMSAIEYSYAV
jgi:hypothetical protein